MIRVVPDADPDAMPDAVSGPWRRRAPRSAALVTGDGEVVDLPVERWHGPADAAEVSLLGAVADPVLDVGCGPGRIVAALAGAGRIALGVDPSPAAVDLALRSRAPVLRRSVFGPLPGEGRWATVLLLDGNVGIGGDPVVLLRRSHSLLRAGGQVVAEVGPPGSATGALRVRVEASDGVSPWFPWARVAADAFAGLARAAGLRPAPAQAVVGRWFVRASRP